MKFTLTIECDNAAFTPGDDARGDEVARILTTVSQQVADGYIRGQMYDVNGNTVGVYQFFEEAK